jgi:hypothetical protein
MARCASSERVRGRKLASEKRMHTPAQVNERTSDLPRTASQSPRLATSSVRPISNAVHEVDPQLYFTVTAEWEKSE